MWGGGFGRSKLGVVCISHFHGDHINGLPGFLSTMALNQHDKPVVVAAPRGLGDYFRTLRRLGIFVPRFGIEPRELGQEGTFYQGDRLRLSMASEPFVMGNCSAVVTISAGISGTELADFPSFDALLDSSNQALYGAKRSGKNCVFTYAAKPLAEGRP